MRALALTEFGDPDVLELVDVDDPTPAPDTVVVDVAAAGVNPVDHKIVAGHLRGAFPFDLPLIPGWDVAGTVVAVGPAVPEIAEGDRVVGYVRKDHLGAVGTFAEQVAAHPRHLAPAPRTVDLETAAALPLAGLTALQSLRRAHVGPGDVVLIHNAGGGVGSFAVQLAVHAGATVIGTGSESGHDRLRDLGAIPVAYGDGLADRVRDALSGGGVGTPTAAMDYVGTDEATEVSLALLDDPSRAVSITNPAIAERGGTYWFVRPQPEDLALLSRLVDTGALRIDVTGRWPLAEGAAALTASAEGHARGKLVITAG
ncbi:NADP-dependent oxidoreductase [Euzebya sp.]|uniref:NADP-dependent oxidoreductase n=1 Tax=Euzebya sp. TaxID=1971409 RepID=UPI0035141BE1